VLVSGLLTHSYSGTTCRDRWFGDIPDHYVSGIGHDPTPSVSLLKWHQWYDNPRVITDAMIGKTVASNTLFTGALLTLEPLPTQQQIIDKNLEIKLLSIRCEIFLHLNRRNLKCLRMFSVRNNIVLAVNRTRLLPNTNQ